MGDNNSADDHLCPITHEVMRDPVMASDGQTYEREAIESWFKEGKMTSPITNETLSDQKLIPNYSLKYDDYLCPITHEVMRVPVMASDGQTYEREAIESWFKEGNMTSP